MKWYHCWQWYTQNEHSLLNLHYVDFPPFFSSPPSHSFSLVAAVFLAVVTLSWISISTFMFKNVSLAISQIIASVGRRKPPGEKKKIPQKFFKIYALQQLIILPLSQPFHPPAIDLSLPLSDVSVPLGPVVSVCQSFSFSVYSQYLLSDPL